MNEQVFVDRPVAGVRVDMSHPLSYDLRGCWLLNEAGYTAFDSSPYANNGTLTNFTDPPMRRFNGLKFDGSDDFVSVPTITALNPPDVTVEAWFYTDAQVDDAGIVGRRGVAIVYLLGHDSAGRYRFRCGNTAPAAAQANADLTEYDFIGKWRHLVGTFGKDLISIYVDSHLAGTAVLASPLLQTNSDVTAIGNDRVATRYHNGKIALVRIWGRCLQAQDVTDLYLHPYAPKGRPFFI